MYLRTVKPGIVYCSRACTILFQTVTTTSAALRRLSGDQAILVVVGLRCMKEFALRCLCPNFGEDSCTCILCCNVTGSHCHYKALLALHPVYNFQGYMNAVDGLLHLPLRAILPLCMVPSDAAAIPTLTAATQVADTARQQAYH